MTTAGNRSFAANEGGQRVRRAGHVAHAADHGIVSGAAVTAAAAVATPVSTTAAVATS